MYFTPIPAQDYSQMRNQQTGAGGGAPAGLGQLTQGIPLLNQPPVQYPQLTQLPYFHPNPQGFAQYTGQGMPFIRNRAIQNALGPLMQPNYGLPFVDPYGGAGQAPMPGASPFPVMGGGLGSGGLGGGGLQMPGLGRWGVQPIRGAIS